MAYQLKAITIRTNNSPEGMKKIEDLWKDIVSGQLPLLFDSEHVFQTGISPVSGYSNYSTDESGDYDLTIMAVTAGFFHEMEEKVSKGLYKKYDYADAGGNIRLCTQKAWEKVWSDRQAGLIQRTFTEDYESTVPAGYTQDGQAHCYLYIAVK